MIHKYRAKPCVIDGEKFRSQKEARRHQELVLLQRAGRISELRREVPLVLAPGVKIAGEKRARPAMKYVADWCYRDETGALVYEDAKGFATPVFRLKKHLMKTVHGIDVKES
jgi:hypothetical protein